MTRIVVSILGSFMLLSSSFAQHGGFIRQDGRPLSQDRRIPEASFTDLEVSRSIQDSLFFYITESSHGEGIGRVDRRRVGSLGPGLYRLFVRGRDPNGFLRTFALPLNIAPTAPPLKFVFGGPCRAGCEDLGVPMGEHLTASLVFSAGLDRADRSRPGMLQNFTANLGTLTFSGQPNSYSFDLAPGKEQFESFGAIVNLDPSSRRVISFRDGRWVVSDFRTTVASGDLTANALRNSSVSNFGLRIFHDEALFLEKADIQFTRNITERPGPVTQNSFGSAILLSDRSIVLDTGRGASCSLAAAPCWTASTHASATNRGVGSFGLPNTMRFGFGVKRTDSKNVKAVGFLLRPQQGQADPGPNFSGWDVTITETNNEITRFQMGNGISSDGKYLGFVSEIGIRSIDIRDAPDDGERLLWEFARISRSAVTD
ncbi:MAG: hypothetical protein AAF438_13065 [Pseudomonadota bacterium]